MRNAARGQQQRNTHFIFIKILAYHRKKAFGVVVFQERNQFSGVLIDKILRKRGVNPIHATVPAKRLVEGGVNGPRKGKIAGARLVRF